MKTTPTPAPEITATYLVALLPFLPPGWTVREYKGTNASPETPELYHPETRTALGITSKRYGLPVGMLEINHHRPTGKDGRYVEVSTFEDVPPMSPGAYQGKAWVRHAAPAIRVSASKKPEQIAHDIAKRIIPEAVRVTALVLAKIAADEQYASDQLATLHRMHKAAQTEARYQSGDKARPYYDLTAWSSGPAKSKYVEIEVRGADCVQIKGSFTAADAEKLLAFLKSEILK